jgi:ABC-type lipoprotein release transport system permease subunit
MRNLWNWVIQTKDAFLALTELALMYLIGFIILLVVTLIRTFLRLGRLIIAKLMKVKTLKIFGNEKIPVRIGYMGAGMILAAHWTLEPILFICGFSCVLVQVSYRKQWNLVALNINGLIAWIIHFLK